MEKKLVQEAKYQYICGKCNGIYDIEESCVKHETICGRKLIKFYTAGRNLLGKYVFITPNSYMGDKIFDVRLTTFDYFDVVNKFNNGDKCEAENCFWSNNGNANIFNDESDKFKDFIIDPEGKVEMFIYECIDDKLVRI